MRRAPLVLNDQHLRGRNADGGGVAREGGTIVASAGGG